MTTPDAGGTTTSEVAPFKYRTEPVPTTKMPRSIPFIVANEFAERFSFYGMKAILVVFMTQYMIAADGSPDHLSGRDANIWAHNFNSFVYFTPILGALIADIFWGKYRTILWISLLYCVGHGVLAMGETRTHLIMGLFLIGLGAGGIKPCVSANVGDQFSKSNEHLLSQVYNWFYFSINLGASLAQLLTPVLLKVYGTKVAFGVPGVLMALAAFVFWMGRRQYVHRPALGFAKVKENFTGENLKILLRLILFFMFVAPFYALYDEGSGSWVDQARYMDLHIGGVTVLQSQVQSINGILILVFIPIFSYGVYPLVGKFVKLTPQRKIAAGMFVLIPTFLVAYHIEKGMFEANKYVRMMQGVEAIAGDLDKQVAANPEVGPIAQNLHMVARQIDATIQTIPNRPSVWWQFLAYTLLTAAEIMVSVPALEFAYTQAPKKMKSMIMAAYLAGSISFGNVIASFVVTQLKRPSIAPHVNDDNSANYYLVFVGLIAVAAVLYCVVSKLIPSRDFVGEDKPEGAAA